MWHVVIMIPTGGTRLVTPRFLMDEYEHPMAFDTVEAAQAAMKGAMTEKLDWYVVDFDKNDCRMHGFE